MMHSFSAKAGDILFSPGAPCPGFLLLDRGTIRVSLTAANGREVVLYRVQPGTVCLQSFECLTCDTTYSAEGVVEADIEGHLVPAASFATHLAEDAAFRTQVMAAIADRFGQFQRLVEDVALTGFDTRLARALLRLRDEAGLVAATHHALAAETASGRAFVSRRLAEFARLGLVQQEKGGVRIVDASALSRIAEDTA